MASKVIAVAGGSGQLGRAIVEALLAHGGYKVFVLGREANEAKSKELGAQILAADYSNVSSLVGELESNNIDTLISTISTMAGVEPELALIKAAETSKVTKRYIPSTWGISYTPEIVKVFPFASVKITALDTLAASGLEYTSVSNGFFLDYFGIPHIKTYLSPLPFALDIANNVAAIPGSGNVPITFTYTLDVGRFVARLLGESKWETESTIIGDKVTWNELLAIAEEAKGTKFKVTYDSLETLQKGQSTELPGQEVLYAYFPKEALQGMLSVFGVVMEQGHFNFDRSGSLNEKFADLKTTSARELLTEAWKGK